MYLADAVGYARGESKEIGTATARALAAAGARPLVAGRDRDRLAAVAAETGGVALTADLGLPGGADALADAALRAAPDGIDVLVNNAGIGWAGPLGGIPGAAQDQQVAA